LHRITRPGAYLALSVHGPHYYQQISKDAVDVLNETGFYYLKVGNTEGLPDFYQATFHSHDYIRKRWSDWFEILHIAERGISNAQDGVLCRKRLA
jgi:hypothetical protein